MCINKTRFVLGIGFIFAIVTMGELFARYYLDLGTPPLSETHPTIEYIFKPNQNVTRFSNHVIINSYGMRSENFSNAKSDPEELRILIFGDSVVNGGNLIDQKELATSKLKKMLIKKGYKKVVVGNISAGSWGPGNWLAYIREFGVFDADIAILVISSHDYADNPSFEPLNQQTHPTITPVSALYEGITRYLPRYLPQIKGFKNINSQDEFLNSVCDSEVEKGLQELLDLLESLRSQVDNVLIFQHWEQMELKQQAMKVGGQQIKQLCVQNGFHVVSLAPYFNSKIKIGIHPYHDNIHTNSVGQQLLAEAIFDNLPFHDLKNSKLIDVSGLEFYYNGKLSWIR